MQVIDIAIATVTASSAIFFTAQFISGLFNRQPKVIPIASEEPTVDAVQETTVNEFVPNPCETEYTDEDRQLVQEWIDRCNHLVITDNVVPFTRPVKTPAIIHAIVPFTRPAQPSIHPALKGLSLRKMRVLGAELKIKGARRWNTQQAIEALTKYYGGLAA